MGFLLWLLLLPAMYVFIRYALPTIVNNRQNRKAQSKTQSKGKKNKPRKSRGFKGLMLIGSGLVGYRLYLVMGLTIAGIILAVVLVIASRRKLKAGFVKITTIIHSGTVKVTDVPWGEEIRTEIVWIDGKRFKRKFFRSKDGGEYSIDTFMPVDMENTTKTYDAETNTTTHTDDVTGEVVLEYVGTGDPKIDQYSDPDPKDTMLA